jgi:peptidoglycan/LPS O-acetylase OafA/YrhL
MISRENNFDLLRLVAAIQVLFQHAISHLEINNLNKFTNILSHFPGVLMFFTISGFLIFSSFDRNKDLKKYFINRFLRLFPALWFCFLITLGLLLFFNIIAFNDIFSWTIIKWIFTQVTVFQFWTPDVLRSWGVGTPNGSLWTIPVELQFYIFLPLIILLFKKIRLVYKFLFFITFSLVCSYYISSKQGMPEALLIKLLGVSIVPYLYCFLTGSMMYLFWDKIRKLIEGKALYWLLFYIIFNLIFDIKPSYTPVNLQLISNLLISIVTISLAYTLPKLSLFLKGNDISYGMYIYHMLVINSLISFGYLGDVKYLFLTIIITIAISSLSWFLIEKKALQLKNKFLFNILE